MISNSNLKTEPNNSMYLKKLEIQAPIDIGATPLFRINFVT